MGEQDSQQIPSARLLSEVRQLLAEMSLLQYGKTQAFDASGGKSENPDPRPSGESWPLADKWAERWAREPTQATLDGARAELQAWKVRQAPAETDDSTLEDWVIEDGEGYAVAQVASKFGIAEARVRRIRLKADRESEFGLPLRFAQHRDDSRARVLNLASQGCTLRQIEMQTGKPRETVRRWLKEAA